MSDINYHPDYHSLNKMWTKCRDVLSGEDEIKRKGTTYLSQLKGQDSQDYLNYLNRGAFYNATFKTSAALVGMAVRKQPRVINSVESVNRWITQDFDMLKNDIWRFSTRVVQEKVDTGRVGVLLDMPALPENGTLADQERTAPYAVVYSAEQIINWHYDKYDRLVMVTLHTREPTLNADFTTDIEDNHLILAIDESGNYYQQHYVKESPSGGRIYPKRKGEYLKELPFFLLDVDEVTDKPPLYDIVNLNIRHYRLYADFAHLLHFTAIPTLVITGVSMSTQDELSIGSEKAMVITSSEARAEWIKSGSDGAEPIKGELMELENRMAAIGAQILQDRVDRETAQAAQLRNAYNTSFLSLIVQETSAMMTKVIRFGGWWMDAKLPDDFLYELDTDFNTKPLPAAELQVLVQAYQAGSLSLESFVHNLERGEYLAPGTTTTEEMGRIKLADPQPTQVKLEMSGGIPSSSPKPQDEAKKPKENEGPEA